MKKLYNSRIALGVLVALVLLVACPDRSLAQTSISLYNAPSGYGPIAKYIAPGSSKNMIAGIVVAPDMNTTLTGITLKTAGTYTTADIAPDGFKLWYTPYYSSDPLSGATLVAQAGPVASGGNIVFSGNLQALAASHSVVFYVTVDLTAEAVVDDTISIASAPLTNFTFSTGTPTGGTLSAWPPQTIGTPRPIIYMYDANISERNVAPASSEVMSYAINVEIKDADAVITSLTVPVTGTYATSDFEAGGFKLWHRTYTDTVLLKAVSAVVSGGNLVFSGLSEVLKKGIYNSLIITADLSANAVSGHTFGIASFPSGNITFEQYQQISGASTFNDGPLHTVAIPSVTMHSAPVAAGPVSPGSYNNVLYKLGIASVNASAQFSQVIFHTSGTYQDSDIPSGGFRIYSGDSYGFNPWDMVASVNPVASGGTLVFNIPGLAVYEDDEVYLYLTADLSTTAVTGRTIAVQAAVTADLTLKSGTLTGSGNAGGVQTITAATVSFSAAGPAAATVSAGTYAVLHTAHISVTGAPMTFTSASYGLSGTYGASDFQDDEIYLVYHKTSDLLTEWNDGETVSAINQISSMPASGGTLTFTYNAQLDYMTPFIPLGEGYISVVAKLSSSPVTGHTIQLSSSGTSGYTFRSGTKSGSTGNGGIQTMGEPSVVATAVATPDGSISPGTEAIVYRIQLDVANASAVLKGASFTTAGTYTYYEVNGFSLYLSNDLTLSNDDIYLDYESAPSAGNTMTYSIYYERPIPVGTTYLLLVASTGQSAALGKTFSITATPASSLSLLAGSITGGTFPAGGIQTFAEPSSIEVSFPEVPTGQIHAGSTNNIIYAFTVIPSGASARLNDLSIQTTGNYELADLENYESFVLYYNSVNSLENAEWVSESDPVLPGEVISFAYVGQSIAENTPGYFLVVANISAAATPGHTIGIDAVDVANFNFAYGSATGTGPVGHTYEIAEAVTGLFDKKSTAHFAMYPNPSLKNETVTVATGNQHGKLVSVYSSTGLLLQTMDTNTSDIHLMNMEKGLYMITIRDLESNVLETKRLIVE